MCADFVDLAARFQAEEAAEKLRSPAFEAKIEGVAPAEDAAEFDGGGTQTVMRGSFRREGGKDAV